MDGTLYFLVHVLLTNKKKKRKNKQASKLQDYSDTLILFCSRVHLSGTYSRLYRYPISLFLSLISFYILLADSYYFLLSFFLGSIFSLSIF